MYIRDHHREIGTKKRMKTLFQTHTEVPNLSTCPPPISDSFASTSASAASISTVPDHDMDQVDDSSDEEMPIDEDEGSESQPTRPSQRSIYGSF